MRQLRKTLNISQKQLAVKLGKSQAVISQWENHISTPSLGTINKLAKIFQVPEQTIIDSLKKNTADTNNT